MFSISLRDIGLNSDYKILKASSVASPCNNSIMFLSKLDDKSVKRLLEINQSLVIVPRDQCNNHLDRLSAIQKKNLVLKSEEPKLEYALILDKILKHIRYYNDFDENNYVQIDRYLASRTNVKIHESVTIGSNVVIGPNTHIGINSRIYDGVKIHGNTKIGDNVVVGYNSIIGYPGFGFARTTSTPVRIPHVGGVIIGNNVDIGCLNTIVAGTIEPTFIGDGTKVDDHVHIGHNAQIGKNCIITACAEMGRMNMGNDVWVGPNSSIIQGVEIGDKAYIGISSVVTKNVEKDSIVAGSPATTIDNLKKIRSFFKANVFSK